MAIYFWYTNHLSVPTPLLYCFNGFICKFHADNKRINNFWRQIEAHNKDLFSSLCLLKADWIYTDIQCGKILWMIIIANKHFIPSYHCHISSIATKSRFEASWECWQNKKKTRTMKTIMNTKANWLLIKVIAWAEIIKLKRTDKRKRSSLKPHYIAVCTIKTWCVKRQETKAEY